MKPSHQAERLPAPWNALLQQWRTIENHAAWFVLANFLDCAMTFLLLMYGGHRGLNYVEGNRIAAHFIHHWGWKGLFGFKFAVVVFVCLIAWGIAFKRPETAQGLLALGTLIVTLVVLYSVWLYVH
jgi:hypothetical protein